MAAIGRTLLKTIDDPRGVVAQHWLRIIEDQSVVEDVPLDLRKDRLDQWQLLECKPRAIAGRWHIPQSGCSIPVQTLESAEELCAVGDQYRLATPAKHARILRKAAAISPT